VDIPTPSELSLVGLSDFFRLMGASLILNDDNTGGNHTTVQLSSFYDSNSLAFLERTIDPAVNISSKSRSISLNFVLCFWHTPQCSRHTVADTSDGIQRQSIEIVFNREGLTDLQSAWSKMRENIEMLLTSLRSVSLLYSTSTRCSSTIDRIAPR